MKKLIASDKVVKYAKARAKGLSKEKSRDEAGYSVSTRPQTIEATEQYKAISVKDELLSQIPLKDIVSKHKSNILSDNEMVSNVAIKMAYERIEPDSALDDKDVESVTIIMK